MLDLVPEVYGEWTDLAAKVHSASGKRRHFSLGRLLEAAGEATVFRVAHAASKGTAERSSSGYATTTPEVAKEKKKTKKLPRGAAAASAARGRSKHPALFALKVEQGEK